MHPVRPRLPRPARAARRLAGLATAALLTAAPAGAQSPPAPTVIPAHHLQEDVAVLQRAYETLHPGLYRYADSAQVAARFDALRRELGRDRTLPEAYLAISAFLATVRCGHSYANFFNQPEAVAAAVLRADRVPFLFRWMGRRMIVTRNLSAEPALAPGAEILAVNGVPAAEILRRLVPLARADGANDAKRTAQMEVTGRSRFEAFDVYFPLLFPLPPGAWRFDVAGSGALPARTVAAPPLTYAARLAATAPAAAGRNDAPLWELRMLEPRTGYLRMPTWSTFHSRRDWRADLDSVFDRLVADGADDLVIDLRGNEGGSSVGDVILGRLATHDLALDLFRRRVRLRSVPAELRPYLDTWDPSFFDWGPAATDFRDGLYTLTRYDDAPGATVVRASARPFRGGVHVLVDASNSSATFEFAQAAQKFGLATLVGQPTGGNQRGINGGAFFFLRLPRSGIEVDLPLIGFFPDGERPDGGLVPDVLVEPRAEDVARGVDTELEAVLARVRERRGGQ